MSTPLPLREVLAEASTIAADAATLLMRAWRKHGAVRKKGVIDLVTDSDLASEALIRERMARTFPAHGLVAEEGRDTPVGDWIWYVDPLDGTTNFAHGHPFFCVSLALCERGEPRVGVVSAPALGVSWASAQGFGATRNGERCHVSETRALDDALCATGFPYDRRTSDENNFREFTAFKLRTQGVRRCGSAAIDLALVADGTYDAYWEQKLKPWDLGAGALLVREAGGQVTDYDGTPADVRTGRLVATNGHVHAETLALLAATRGSPATPRAQ